MALEPGVITMQPAAATSAPNRVGAGGRFSSGEQLEGMAGSPFVGVADQWRASNEMDAGQGGANRWLRSGGTPILFTPRVSLAAASYPAIAAVDAEVENQGPAPTADLQRGVGIYEHYMRVTSDTQRNIGSVVNRFS